MSEEEQMALRKSVEQARAALRAADERDRRARRLKMEESETDSVHLFRYNQSDPG